MRCRTEAQNKRPQDSLTKFLQCANLILPWMTPQELATISLTSKTLNLISKSIAFHRTLDASRSIENHPIPFITNSIDQDQNQNQNPYYYFIYVPSQILPSSSIPRRQYWGPKLDSMTQQQLARIDVDHSVSGFGCGCDNCEENDDDECPCVGLQGMDMASECGPGCSCGLGCVNRVTQRGVSVRVKIVRDDRKGWALYADQLIEQGQFVCEYAGELLRTDEARRRQQIYDRDKASSGAALLVVREHLPTGNACLRINIDATLIGNVARFINHSCDGGNLATKLVRSSGTLLPRLCFFASKDIKQDEELTFSYGDIRLNSNGLPCFCGSSCCSGVLPSEHT